MVGVETPARSAICCKRHSLRSWVHVTNSLPVTTIRECRIILRNYFGKMIEGPAMDLLSVGSAADI